MGEIENVIARVADEAAAAAMESLNKNGVDTPDSAVDGIRDYIADQIDLRMR